MQDNIKTLFFTIVICIVSSSFLTLASTLLKPRQEANKEVDKIKNILQAAGLLVKGKSNQEILDIATKTVKLETIATENPQETLPLYIISKDSNSKPVGYIIPISGKGLWSTLYGYLCIGPDLNTVIGISFYQHGETPGLGAEIEEEWFLANFKGKKINDLKGNLVGIEVVKGKAEQKYKNPELLSHAVDGISGATITSNGVTKLIKTGLESYQNYFATLSKSNQKLRETVE